MKTKFTSTIAGASIFISVLMLVGKGIGFIREILFAGYFGTSQQYDLYLVSAVFPITINVIIYFLGQNYFIPSFSKVVSNKPEYASRFVTQSLTIFIFSGFGLMLIMLLCSDFIMKQYLVSSTNESRLIALRMFRVFLLSIPISSGIAILSAYLHSKLEFRYPAISNLFLNLMVIFLVVLLAQNFGTYIIAIAYVIGSLFQFSYLFLKAYKLGEIKLNKIKFGISFFKDHISSSVLIIVIIEAIGQLYMIIDRGFYSEVDNGGIASLNYAFSLFQLPISIFTFAIITAIFPRISKAYSTNNFDEIKKILTKTIRISLVLFIPISMIFIMYGDTIIRLVYERGQFSSDGTLMVLNILRLYSFSLAIFSIYSVLNKVFYSGGFLKSLLAITIIGILFKAILNILLVKDFQQNGLALSTSLSYIAFFAMSTTILRRKIKFSILPVFFSELVMISVNGILAFFIAYILMKILSFNFLVVGLLSICIFCVIIIINLLVIQHSAVGIIKKMKFKFANSAIL